MRELTVLGTASQVPTRERNHNGYLLRWDGEGLLFDPGEGCQRQLVRAGIPASAVDRICLTHLHGDHSLGLPGVLARRRLEAPDAAPAVLHYPERAAADVAVLRRAGSPAGPLPAVELAAPAAGGVLARRPGTGGDLGWELSALPLDHRVPCVGYRLQEPDGVTLDPRRCAEAGLAGPDLGRLRRDGAVRVGGRTVTLAQVSTPRRGQAFAVVMDTRVTPSAVALAAGVDLLLCEATFRDRDRELAEAHGHLTAGQAGELAAQAGVGTLVLTHFSRRYGPDPEPARVEAAARFGGEVIAAADLDVIPLPPRRRVLPG